MGGRGGRSTHKTLPLMTDYRAKCYCSNEVSACVEKIPKKCFTSRTTGTSIAGGWDSVKRCENVPFLRELHRVKFGDRTNVNGQTASQEQSKTAVYRLSERPLKKSSHSVVKKMLAGSQLSDGTQTLYMIPTLEMMSASNIQGPECWE